MPSGDLARALQIAQAYCWDESHGYSQQYDGMGHPGFDCSGLIGRCLYEAGFNYPSSHVGTRDMDDNPMSQQNSLGAAGFSIIHVTDLNNIPAMQHGDIVTMNRYNLDWSLGGGHAFIYAENVYAYNSTLSGDNINYPNTKSTVSRAKIEASKTRSWNVSLADDPNPNTGACTEVWVHAFSTLIPSFYDPQDTAHHNYVTIARWPGGALDGGVLGALLLYKLAITR